MATGFKFVSPSVQFSVEDLSFVQKSAGITTLGIVGEFPKGPAFEPIFIGDKNALITRFGNLNIEMLGGTPRYQSSYVANAYLDESQQLYCTRVLGLSGYDIGKGWAITLNAGVDKAKTGTTTPVITQTGKTFTNNLFNGATVDHVGQTGDTFTGFTKITTTTFKGYKQHFTVTSITGSTGKLTIVSTPITGISYTTYEKMVIAVIRSRADVADVDNANPVRTFRATGLTISANTTSTGVGNVFGTFILKAVGASGTEGYTVSLNPDSRDYIVNVIGDTARGKNSKIYVESIYSDLIKKGDADGFAYGVNTTLVTLSNAIYTDYKSSYTTPETPWVVSELRGSSVSRLFKAILISDGDTANREVKISIENVNPGTKEFDVIIRDFYDTDDNTSILETFKRCSMRESLNNYVGKRIGTSDKTYDLKSNYLMLEIDANAPADAFPCGFEGYNVRSYATTFTGIASVLSPAILFKKSYATFDKVKKTYLGISEKAFDGVGIKGTGIDSDIFKFKGATTSTGFTKTKGFHLDSGVTGTYNDGNISIGQFEVGAGRIRLASDLTTTSPYFDIASRKFTLVASGGFDGWDEHRISRTNTDLYAIGQVFDGVPNGSTIAKNDYQAWQQGFATFESTDDIIINLFTTPGINWSDNLSLVNEGIDLVEDIRKDCLYIIDAPRLFGADPFDVVDLLDSAEIDSSYSATYYPWIKIADTTNNKNIFLPPTLEIVKSIAFNDNIAFPWFAPAGLVRGVTDAKDADATFSLGDRDVLYDGRINPMAKFNGTGIAIFGQKTLQIKESALDRINVVRLLLELKVLISNIAVRLLFDQDDQAVRDQFTTKVNPILDSVKRERGLQEFKVVMDDSNNTPETGDRNELYGTIFLKPTRAVEFIGIKFTVTPSGASFEL